MSQRALPPFRPSRRELARLVGAGLLLPAAGPARAAPAVAPSQRRFLFVFCKGGYDPTWLFAPMADADGVDTSNDTGASVRSAGGLSWVHNDMRASVSPFLERYAARTCFINGFEVRSVTHEACRRIILTGGTSNAADDWISTIAAADAGVSLPALILSGPSFTAANGNSVVRVGEDGQLARLLSGEALERSTQAVGAPPADVASAIDALLHQRSAAFAAGAGRGRAGRFAQDLDASLARLDTVRGLDELDLSVATDGYVYVSDRVEAALPALEQGLARCVAVEHRGEWGVGWDSHSGLNQQGANFDTLFDDLTLIMAELESRSGPAGGSLADETVVVVYSEMGRAPRLNATGGKDHWTFTSAMLLGPGVAGGTVVGGYDEQLVGVAIDPDSGQPDSAGFVPDANSFGSTLFELAGLDGEALTGAPPLRGALAD